MVMVNASFEAANAESPAYFATSLFLPFLSDLSVIVTTPFLTVPLPTVLLPRLMTTLPDAAPVADSLTLSLALTTAPLA